MWIRRQGMVEQDIYMLGTSEVPVYLIRHGATWTLVEGGVTPLGPRLLGQLLAMVEDLSAIESWVITHSHYDHCGLLSTLYGFLPNVTIYASKPATQAFHSRGTQRVVRKLNEEALKLWNRVDSQFSQSVHETLLCDLPVVGLRDGDRIPLGDFGCLIAMATPGHSNCSMSFYEPDRGWLFTGDALGELQEPGTWCPLVFDGVQDYISSIKRMASLNLDAVFLGHHGVLTGQDALAAPVDALQAVYQLKAQVAFAHRAGPSHLNDFIRSQSDLYAPVSEKFVSRQLHRQSMVRMSELLIEDAYSTSFSGPALGAASAEHEFNSFKINLRRSA